MIISEYLNKAIKEWWLKNGTQLGDKEKQLEAMPSIFTLPLIGKLFTWLDEKDPRKIR